MTPGLTRQEAARRLAERGEQAPPSSSRSYASILRANLLTVFNLILLVFGVLTLAFGAPADALFLVILVANSAIGIAQEIRAKHALDRLAALVAPTAKVVRDGEQRVVPELCVIARISSGPGSTHGARASPLARRSDQVSLVAPAPRHTT